MQRKITMIEKSWTNGAMAIPVAWGRLECKHSCRLDYRDVSDNTRYTRGHDESIYVQRVGDAVQCDACDRYVAALEQLRAVAPGTISHSRFRHDDSRGFGPGRYYVYARDPKSPTGCHLLLSIDDTPDAVAALRRMGASPLSPTEAR